MQNEFNKNINLSLEIGKTENSLPLNENKNNNINIQNEKINNKINNSDDKSIFNKSNSALNINVNMNKELIPNYNYQNNRGKTSINYILPYDVYLFL